MTTPAPTIVGRPRRLGSSRCSTEAKNASASACRIDAAVDTNVCSHRALASGPSLLEAHAVWNTAKQVGGDIAESPAQEAHYLRAWPFALEGNFRLPGPNSPSKA